jgi:hypothetical protein
MQQITDRRATATHRAPAGRKSQLENAYGDEILIAAREMDCDKNIFPTVYPFTQKQALDSDYWLD